MMLPRFHNNFRDSNAFWAVLVAVAAYAILVTAEANLVSMIEPAPSVSFGTHLFELFVAGALAVLFILGAAWLTLRGASFLLPRPHRDLSRNLRLGRVVLITLSATVLLTSGVCELWLCFLSTPDELDLAMNPIHWIVPSILATVAAIYVGRMSVGRVPSGNASERGLGLMRRRSFIFLGLLVLLILVCWAGAQFLS